MTLRNHEYGKMAGWICIVHDEMKKESTEKWYFKKYSCMDTKGERGWWDELGDWD